MSAQVAVSLVVHNEFERTLEMILSLAASDLNRWPCKLFVRDNASDHFDFGQLARAWRGECILAPAVQTSKPLAYMRYEENQVNVRPRIDIMAEVLAHIPSFDYLLEIHTDMLFPREWFQPLMAAMQYADVGIAMPWILNGRRVLPEEIELLAGQHRETRKDVNPTQVLPWLLKLEAVRNVGYYDPQYHPGRCEDDDFLMRMYTYGYKGLATKDSVVAHQGGFHSYRKELLPSNNNEQIFQRKFGTTIQRQKELEHSVHPIILV